MSDIEKRCPYCNEQINEKAKKCKHCGEWVTEELVTGSNSHSDNHSLIKQALNNYFKIVEVIGRGGMASVFKAKDLKSHKSVALKIIHQNLVHDLEFIKRFKREAEVSISLNHPSIISVYEVGSIGTIHFISMEFLEGEDLHQKIKKSGLTDFNLIIQWITEIAYALDYVHSKGLIHRDIKTSNIFITNSGKAVLMDFGIAHAADSTKLTQTGSVIGTPEYMSPEQANGNSSDGRSDLYSLGVVLYECITSKVPFRGDNPLTTIHKIIYSYPEIPSLYNPAIPDWLSSIVLKLLSKNPDDRFENGKELAIALAKRKTFSNYQTDNNITQKLQSGISNINNQDNFNYRNGSVSKNKFKKSTTLLMVGIGIAAAILIFFGVKEFLLSDNNKIERDLNLSENFQEKKSVDIENDKQLDSQFISENERLGDFYLQQGNYKMAKEYYKKGLVEKPNDSILLIKLDELQKTSIKQSTIENEVAEQIQNKDFTEPTIKTDKVKENNIIQNEKVLSEKVSPVNENIMKEESTAEMKSTQAESDPKPEKIISDTENSRIKAKALEMVFVKGGKFRMGNNNGSVNQKPEHEVELSDFYIGKYEIVQLLWEEIMGHNPSYNKGADLPVENVSWNDVQSFITKLNNSTGKKYRLPSEAEWEYAARGGNLSKSYTYSGDNISMNVAWTWENSNAKTHPVGQKKPNELGIYDMSGNVNEWCNDWFLLNYYKRSPPLNPQGPNRGLGKIFRGGSWSIKNYESTVTYRDFKSSHEKAGNIGFRLVQETN